MRLLLISLLLMMVASTISPMAKAGEHDWEFIKFSEVRAYRMNWDKMDSFASIIRDGGGLNATRRPTGSHFAVYDVTGLVDAGTAALAAAYDYNAFGETVKVEGEEIAQSNSWQFSTKYLDEDTGLYY